MNCPVCATDLSAGTRSCPRCGHEIQAGPAVSAPAWLSSSPGDPAPAAPEEPPQWEQGFAYQTDSWPTVAPTAPTPSYPSPYRYRQAPRSRLVVVAAVCVLGVGALVWKVGFHGSDTPGAAPPATSAAADPVNEAPVTDPITDPVTPSPIPETTTPVEADVYPQLNAIEAILTRSVNSRALLHRALQQPCREARAAEASVRQVVSQRQQQIASANGLDVSQLPDGEDLRANLARLLTYSLLADQAYDRGELAVIRYGCGAGASDTTQGNNISSDQAQPAKQTFIDMWFPLAAQYGITPMYGAGDI
jgi:hypothetical protein